MSNHHFNTPPGILARVRRLDPRGIGLDPCSNAHSMVHARTEWDRGGLDGAWHGRGFVFMNPPHSMRPNNIEPWIEKAHTEFIHPDFPLRPDRADSAFKDQFVGLIPAKPDTAWFHDYVTQFPLRVFLRGRPKFWLDGTPMPGPGKFASMLIYAGNKPGLFREIFAARGWVI